MRLGMFDPPEIQPYATGITPRDVNTQSSQASVQANSPMHACMGTILVCAINLQPSFSCVQYLALEAARESIVLLKNDGN